MLEDFSDVAVARAHAAATAPVREDNKAARRGRNAEVAEYCALRADVDPNFAFCSVRQFYVHALEPGRIGLGDFTRLPRRDPLERFDRACMIDMDDGVELIGET